MRQIVPFARDIVDKSNRQAAMNVRHVFEMGLDPLRAELDAAEDLGTGLKSDRRAVQARWLHLCQLGRLDAALEGLRPFMAVAMDRRDQLFRKSVDNGRTDAMKAAGVNIAAVLAAEFAARMQRR